MFATRAFARQVRSFGTTAAKPSGYKEKTLWEVWTGDAGAYPVMGVIAFACVFSVGAGLFLMQRTPDARITKDARKSTLRGELKGVN